MENNKIKINWKQAKALFGPLFTIKFGKEGKEEIFDYDFKELFDYCHEYKKEDLEHIKVAVDKIANSIRQFYTMMEVFEIEDIETKEKEDEE